MSTETMKAFRLAPGTKRRGFTLTEVLLALAVGATVVIGAVVYYISTQNEAKIQQAYGQVNATAASMRTWYAGRTNFGNSGTDLTQAAVTARIFPDRMLDGETPRNPWGEEITLVSNGSSLYITYPGVPQEACAKLVAMSQISQGGGVLSLRVGSTDMEAPIDPAAAAIACENSDTVRWEVR